MNNFTFQNPVKLIFGKGSIAKLAKEIPADKKIMVTFGGGSVKKNGVYDQVVAALKGRDFVEFWGIEPNPKIETLRKAIAQGKAEKVDFLLSVGGGSVLDGTKLIAAGIPYDGDAWELVLDEDKIGEVVPFGDVMTLPATGSEMNAGAVISNLATQEKFAFHHSFPQFSILDPEATFSLPPFQVACGIADTFVHVMEQYLTVTGVSPLMDRWAEGILQTLIEIAPKIRANQHDYDQMANFMLCATMGLNGFIAMGVPQDWATHMIGHELTALHGVTHGQTLVVVLPALMSVMREQKKGKILQYGERVFGIREGSEDERIDRTIRATEEFFRSLGLATRLHELQIGQDTIDEIVRRFNERGSRLGEAGNITGDVTRRILELCNKGRNRNRRSGFSNPLRLFTS
ncbi:iron-containing alcohol dehydrogenase [Alistipes putredinis]|nr:iron-containing alcohol dehydrogenase [Alistipes putredinis]